MIGFTGTRHGMTEAQAYEVRDLVMHVHKDTLDECKAHHGDCVGADAEFDEMCESLGIFRIAHPPIDPKLRAFCAAEVILDPLPYHERNREIVQNAALMIAAPNTRQEVKRGSGTWSTIRYSEDVGVPCIIVFPDGTAGRLVR